MELANPNRVPNFVLLSQDLIYHILGLLPAFLPCLGVLDFLVVHVIVNLEWRLVDLVSTLVVKLHLLGFVQSLKRLFGETRCTCLVNSGIVYQVGGPLVLLPQ